MTDADNIIHHAYAQGESDRRIGHPHRTERSIWTQALCRAGLKGRTRKEINAVKGTMTAHAAKSVIRQYGKGFNGTSAW